MMLTLEVTAASRGAIRRHREAAGKAPVVLAAGLQAAVVAGSESIREQLVRGTLGLTMRNPASGLAGAVDGWMIDESAPLGAVGVPGNSPAAAYARMLERGGTIRPKQARALAVPVTDEARRYTSPRDMPDLILIQRKGKPPVLARKSPGGKGALEVLWVLLPYVTIPAFHWLSKGAREAKGEMSNVFQDVLNEYSGTW